jgi:hypothetical protein
MARFELTISGGTTMVVEHAATTPNEMLLQLTGSDFVLFSEVKAGAAAREVIVSSSQITLVRPLTEGSTQGSGFRSKR